MKLQQGDASIIDVAAGDVVQKFSVGKIHIVVAEHIIIYIGRTEKGIARGSAAKRSKRARSWGIGLRCAIRRSRVRRRC